MSKTSETGHAKNVANLALLNSHIAAVGALYNPSNPAIQLANLQDLYTKAHAEQERVNTLLAPYTVAVDKREAIFAPLSKQITKIHKAFKASDAVSAAQLEDFMSISRKLKGSKKFKQIKATTTEEEQKSHSTSQMSYDQRTNHMEQLIALLQNTPTYNPNEVEFKLTSLQAQKDTMLQSTQEVSNAYIQLNNARSNRNQVLDLLVDTANKAKDYLATILDTKSPQYKAASKIQFRKN